ncbi:tyrosine-type recombinase/integrase [Geoalkalibacter sp.]|uniref:tyrosine-type recombinase/integrase n=1 Tax=Geoalkalibacter sp. TaxID=3041440 RepID=UPI00272E1B92|nr:tyrosine-type recombinase/integrase [Geoalkalibacter sp.]
MAVRPKKDKHGRIIPGEWVIDVRLEGYKGPRERLPFVGTEAEAREIEMALRLKHRPRVADLTAPTVLDALPEFLRDYSNHVTKGTLGDFHWAWKQLEPLFAQARLANITPELVEAYKAKRLADGVKKRTINRELSYLAAILRWAEEQRIIPPMQYRVKRFPKKQTISPVPIVHSPEEIQAVLDQLNPKIRAIALLLYDAGLRRAEATTLTGAQVDLPMGIIRVVGKGGKERIVPILTERLRHELAERIDQVGRGYLFINPATEQPYKEIRVSLRNAAARAGVDKRIYHHLLRHNHGTHAAMAEVDPRAVQKMMGHSNLSTTELYTHLAADFIKSQGKKFASFIKQPSAKPPQTKTVDRITKKKNTENE